jgi:hypothetical protein
VRIVYGKKTVLGSAKAKVKPGKTGTLKVKLTNAAKKQLKKHKKLKVLLKATVTAKGKKTTLTKKATLKA